MDSTLKLQISDSQLGLRSLVLSDSQEDLPQYGDVPPTIPEHPCQT